MPLILVIYCVAAVAAVILLHSVLFEKVCPNFPPGPRGFPLVGYFPFMRGKFLWEDFERISKKYGNIFSVKLGEHTVVVLNDFECMKEAYRADVFSNRSTMDFYRQWGTLDDTGVTYGILSSSGIAWQEQRRYFLRQLRDLGFGKQSTEPVTLDQLTQFIDILKNKVNVPLNSSDIKEITNLLTLNSLWFLCAGTIFRLDDERLQKFFHEVIKPFEDSMTSRAFYFFPTYLRLFPSRTGWRGFLAGKKRIEDFTEKYISDHKKSHREDITRDFIDAFINQNKNTTDGSSSFYGDRGYKHLTAVLLDILIVGTDTTATAFIWSLLYLCAFPDIQKKLHSEIDRVVGRDRLPTLLDRPGLAHVDAFVNEILRHTSMTPLADFHEVADDTHFRGYNLPKGTKVVANFRKFLFDPKYWDNPNEFNPWRFLTDDGKLKKYDEFVIFGYGKRVCVGEHHAKTSLYYMLSVFLQSFNVVTAENTELPPLEPPEGVLILYPREFQLTITAR